MPRISKINDKVPVIFLGNKVDLRSSNSDNGMFTMLNHTFPEYV